MLRTLLAQLLERYIPEDFVKDFAQLETSLRRHHADPPKSPHYLVELLGKVNASWNRVFIVLDALDECTSRTRVDLIENLRKLASEDSRFSIFVTSRVEQDIIDVLKGVPAISLKNEICSVTADIERVIKDKMNNRHLPLARLDESFRHQVTSTLLEKSEGMSVLPSLSSETY